MTRPTGFTIATTFLALLAMAAWGWWSGEWR